MKITKSKAVLLLALFLILYTHLVVKKTDEKLDSNDFFTLIGEVIGALVISLLLVTIASKIRRLLLKKK